jgi:hypothetical protein
MSLSVIRLGPLLLCNHVFDGVRDDTTDVQESDFPLSAHPPRDVDSCGECPSGHQRTGFAYRVRTYPLAS